MRMIKMKVDHNIDTCTHLIDFVTGDQMKRTITLIKGTDFSLFSNIWKVHNSTKYIT